MLQTNWALITKRELSRLYIFRTVYFNHDINSSTDTENDF